MVVDFFTLKLFNSAIGKYYFIGICGVFINKLFIFFEEGNRVHAN